MVNPSIWCVYSQFFSGLFIDHEYKKSANLPWTRYSFSTKHMLCLLSYRKVLPLQRSVLRPAIFGKILQRQCVNCCKLTCRQYPGVLVANLPADNTRASLLQAYLPTIPVRPTRKLKKYFTRWKSLSTIGKDS